MPPREEESNFTSSHDLDTSEKNEEEDGESMSRPLTTDRTVNSNNNNNNAASAVSAAFFTKLYEEIFLQCQTAYPTLIGMAVSKIPWLLSLRFVGGMGATELAAAALATTLCNVTGMSLSVGLSSALTTLTGQARGELQARTQARRASPTTEQEDDPTENDDSSFTEESLDLLPNEDVEREGLLDADHKSRSKDTSPSIKSPPNRTTKKQPLMPLVYLYRGTIVQLACVLPVGCWWLYGVKSTLLYLGQGEKLCGMTQDYLRILAPQLWAYSINWTLTAWLQAMEMAYVPAYAAVAVLITHIPLNLFYIHVFRWGYLGCAAATVTTQSLQLLYIAGYLFGTQHGKQRVLQNMYATAAGRSALSFWKEVGVGLQWDGIVQYLGLAVPGVIIISEWWASEISIFLAGRLTPYPDLALGGMSLYQSINSFCFMFPLACSVAGATRVSNLLGAGLDKQAAFASHVSILGAALVSGTIGVILYFAPHTFFPSLFAPGEGDLVDETSSVIPLLSLYVFADGIQTAFNGTIKGCGRQVLIMPIVVIAYWITGLPLGYYFAFVRNQGEMCDDDYFCGDVGLVAGMTSGTLVHATLLAVTVLCFTNWELEAQKAYERVRTTQNTKKAVEMLQLQQNDTTSIETESSAGAY